MLFSIVVSATLSNHITIETVTAESSTNSTPAYAFNGAYVTYTLNDYLDRKVTFTISEVDTTAQTFKVSWIFSGSWDFKNKYSSEVFSFSSISPIPNGTANSPFSAASFGDLQMLNSGEVPADMPKGVTVKTNQSIYALGGYYFNTDQVQVPSKTNVTNGFSAFIDMHSGLAAVEDFGGNGAIWGIAYGQLSLVSTNIPMTANVRTTSPSVPESNEVTIVFIAGVSALIIAAGTMVYFKKHKPEPSNEKKSSLKCKSYCFIIFYVG